MSNFITYFLYGLGVLLFALVLSLIFCYPVMLLWNWVMPVLGVSELTFWQMYGFMVLVNLIFKTNITTNNNNK